MPPKTVPPADESLSDGDDDFTVSLPPFKAVPETKKPFGSVMELIRNIIKRIAKLKK